MQAPSPVGKLVATSNAKNKLYPWATIDKILKGGGVQNKKFSNV